MNIWIFNHYATAPYQVGGTRHYDLAFELDKKGHKVTIIASSYNHFLKQENIEYPKKTYFKKENINGVNYVWIRTVKYQKNLKRLFNILDYTKKSYKASKTLLQYEKPDIVIGSSVHPLAAYIGYLISKKANAVFYFEERDLWPQTFIDFGKMSSKNPIAIFLYAFEKYLYNKSKKSIVLFEKAVDYVASRGISHEKAIYLPNGVSLEKYKHLEIDSEIKVRFPSNKYTVIYTGSHGIANDLKPLIKIAKILQDKDYNDIHIILVGNGPQKRELIKQSKEYCLKNITFLDPVPKNKIPYLLSLADLSFISIKNSPLYKWGFSMNKLYDYMAAGLPIMIHSSKEIIGNLYDVHGINLAESPKELAHKIVKRIYDEKYKEEAGNNLKTFVENHYSWEKLASKLEKYMMLDVGKGE